LGLRAIVQVNIGASYILLTIGDERQPAAIGAQTWHPLVELWRVKARRVDEFLGCKVIQQHIPALAGVGFVPRREGDQRAVSSDRRMALGAGRVVELRRRYELLLRHAVYEDLASLVLQLGGEDAEFAVLRKNGMVVLAIGNRRNVADDLSMRDA